MPELAQPLARRTRPSTQGGHGRSLNALAGPLIRALHQVDSACMRVLSQSFDEPDKSAARLELSVWLPLHRALTSHLSSHTDAADPNRIDAVLADDLLAFVDDVLLWVADVEAGGLRRVQRYLAACRQQMGELAAFGGAVAPLRARLQQLEATINKAARSQLPGAERPSQPQNDSVMAHLAQELAELHRSIAQALHVCAPRATMSLLDTLAL